MLPKSIASGSFSGMILVPQYYFQGPKGPIYWAFFKIRKVQFRSLFHIVFIYLFKNLFSKYFANWHGASPG